MPACVTLDEALLAALQTPPEKEQAVRAAMRIPKDRIEIFKEGGRRVWSVRPIAGSRATLFAWHRLLKYSAPCTISRTQHPCYKQYS